MASLNWGKYVLLCINFVWQFENRFEMTHLIFINVVEADCHYATNMPRQMTLLAAWIGLHLTLQSAWHTYHTLIFHIHTYMLKQTVTTTIKHRQMTLLAKQSSLRTYCEYWYI